MFRSKIKIDYLKLINKYALPFFCGTQKKGMLEESDLII